MLQIKNLVARFKVQLGITLQWTLRLRGRISVKLPEGKLLAGNLPGKRYRSMALTAPFRRLNILFNAARKNERKSSDAPVPVLNTRQIHKMLLAWLKPTVDGAHSKAIRMRFLINREKSKPFISGGCIVSFTCKKQKSESL